MGTSFDVWSAKIQLRIQLSAAPCGYVAALLVGIALAQAIPPIATLFFVAWSVCLSSVCHSCTLLKPFDGSRCHLAGTLVQCARGPTTHCVRWGRLPGAGEIWVEHLSKTMELQNATAIYVTNKNEKRFHLFPNYFRLASLLASIVTSTEEEDNAIASVRLFVP